MGNKLSFAKTNDSKFTKSTGLYPTCEWDDKTVKKLINKKKVAPRYPGREESGPELDECPICFLWYPGGLNRSKCCKQPICTECYLQFKKPKSQKQASCPYCNSVNYAVKYTGSMTKEERALLEKEEQKVIEAKLVARKAELERQAEREKEVAAERAAEIERRAREPPPPAPPPQDHRAASRPASFTAGGGGGRARLSGDDRLSNDINPRQHFNGHDGHSNRPHSANVNTHFMGRYRRGEQLFADASPDDGEDEDETGDGGGNMDIEELMIMEAIRLSLMEARNPQVQQGGEAAAPPPTGSGESEDETSEEAGAAGPGRAMHNSHSDRDVDSSNDNEGRCASDDAEEDWPVTSWGEEHAQHLAAAATFRRSEFERVLEQVLEDYSNDAETESLLAHSTEFFNAPPLAAEHASSLASLRGSISRSASSRYGLAPAAVESDSTLSPSPSPNRHDPDLHTAESRESPPPLPSPMLSMPASPSPSSWAPTPGANSAHGQNTPQTGSGATTAAGGEGDGTPAGQSVSSSRAISQTQSVSSSRAISPSLRARSALSSPPVEPFITLSTQSSPGGFDANLLDANDTISDELDCPPDLRWTGDKDELEAHPAATTSSPAAEQATPGWESSEKSEDDEDLNSSFGPRSPNNEEEDAGKNEHVHVVGEGNHALTHASGEPLHLSGFVAVESILDEAEHAAGTDIAATQRERETCPSKSAKIAELRAKFEAPPQRDAEPFSRAAQAVGTRGATADSPPKNPFTISPQNTLPSNPFAAETQRSHAWTDGSSNDAAVGAAADNLDYQNSRRAHARQEEDMLIEEHMEELCADSGAANKDESKDAAIAVLHEATRSSEMIDMKAEIKVEGKEEGQKTGEDAAEALATMRTEKTSVITKAGVEPEIKGDPDGEGKRTSKDTEHVEGGHDGFDSRSTSQKSLIYLNSTCGGSEWLTFERISAAAPTLKISEVSEADRREAGLERLQQLATLGEPEISS